MSVGAPKINSLSVRSAPAVYYHPLFRIEIEKHVEWLRSHSTTTVITLNERDVYRYQSDFYSLLYTLNIPVELHWIILRMNHFTNPSEIPDTITTLYIPNANLISQMVETFKTAKLIGSDYTLANTSATSLG